MGKYRNYRNLEASVLDYITEQLTADGWTDIRVVKAFAEVYKGTIPCICINVEDSDVIDREIGSTSYLEDILVSFRIFAKSDGQRLDLVSWAIEKIMPGIDYYEYVIGDGIVTAKELKGKILIQKVTVNRKELKNTENVEAIDRYRHLLSFKCRIGFVEED